MRVLARCGADFLSRGLCTRALGVSPMRISHVINGKRPITADLALRLGKALHQSPAYWINLQTAYGLATAQREVGRKLQRVVPMVA